jgi:hypothetical protein
MVLHVDMHVQNLVTYLKNKALLEFGVMQLNGLMECYLNKVITLPLVEIGQLLWI